MQPANASRRHRNADAKLGFNSTAKTGLEKQTQGVGSGASAHQHLPVQL
jgi:hypothetical protein